ncbi:MAG: glycine oxidase ThiO [Aquificae bacterium]|nr:glycine oxidase ThiO [Aquificota bacterium]
MKGIIIGGGIIGLSIARELQKAGYTITVIDRQRVGRGSSWAAGGMLAPQSEGLEPGVFLDFCLESRQMYPSFVEELERETDMSVGYWKSGIFCPAYSEEEEEELKRKLETYKSMGLSGNWIDRETLEGRYPSIGREIRGGVFYPDDGQVDNRLLMLALERYARYRGIELVEFNPVKKVVVNGGKFKGVRTATGLVEGDFCIITAGAWSSEFINLPVFPIKGEMAAISSKPKDMDTVFFGSKVYLIPKKDRKRIVVGATEEKVGFAEGNTVKGILQLFTGLRDTLPYLVEKNLLETWYGYRPATDDLLPILGKTQVESLFVATGHYRNGILLAPITAKLISQLIDKGITDRYLEQFSVFRFREG